MSYAVGLMSGTSLDGIDAALVDITGVNELTKVDLIEFITVPYKTSVLEKLQEVLSIGLSDVRKICSLNFELAEYFSEAVISVCEKAKISLDDIAFVASHGQTIFHIPESVGNFSKSTFQIGDPSVIAERTKSTVVSNFRERDMSVGGQGAPIVPFSEYILYKSDVKNVLLQNIGGIGNVTVIPKNASIDDVIAFDTGPGNVMINELCLHFYQKEYDKDGVIAKSGKVNHQLLNSLLNHPYITKAYPKTTGREEFGKQFVSELLSQWSLLKEDWITTVTMFTAKSIALSIKPFISDNTDLIIGGGGSYNQTLINFIKDELPTVNVLIQEDVGKSSEAKEAIAMTILGNQTLHHLPSNVRSATGAKKSVILGSITYYH